MTRRARVMCAVSAMLVLPASSALAQAVGGSEKAIPLPDDPGISWMLVTNGRSSPTSCGRRQPHEIRT
jgi:hypothetical protein